MNNFTNKSAENCTHICHKSTPTTTKLVSISYHTALLGQLSIVGQNLKM